MTDPVFVIHGVKNHVEATFRASVERLQGRLSGYELVPVFWGDLGARSDHLNLVIPPASTDEGTRGPDPSSPRTELEIALLTDGATPAPGVGTRAGDGPVTGESEIEIIAEAAGRVEGIDAGEWRIALEEEWPELNHLSLIDDAELLAKVGVALASEPPEPSEVATRGPVDWAKRRIRDIDRGISIAIGASAGKVNEVLRNKIGPDFAEFAGDIAVYQGDRSRIQERVLSTIRTQGYGSESKPARIICHSLGGVITLDLCVRGDDPLQLLGVVTFGSQWPFFHLVDQRPNLPPFDGRLIILPSAVGSRWINLWEPLDPLAFVASNIFELHDGGRPEDRKAEYDRRSGLWTHSAYWTHPRLFEAVRDAFPAPGRDE